MSTLETRERQIFRSAPVPDIGINLRRGKTGGVKGYHWKQPHQTRQQLEEAIRRAARPDMQCKQCRPSPLFFGHWSGFRISDIQHAVCKFYRVSLCDLVSARRTMDIVRPRQVAIWICRKITVRSLPEIARQFGNRDHTTALASVRRIDALKMTNPDIADAIDKIIKNLGAEDLIR